MVFIGVNKKYDNYHEMKGKEREMRILLNNAVGGFSGTQTGTEYLTFYSLHLRYGRCRFFLWFCDAYRKVVIGLQRAMVCMK